MRVNLKPNPIIWNFIRILFINNQHPHRPSGKGQNLIKCIRPQGRPTPSWRDYMLVWAGNTLASFRKGFPTETSRKWMSIFEIKKMEINHTAKESWPAPNLLHIATTVSFLKKYIRSLSVIILQNFMEHPDSSVPQKSYSSSCKLLSV